LHFAAESIGCASQIDDSGYSGAADRDIGNPAPPWTTKRVRHDHGSINAEAMTKAIANSSGRAIGVNRKQSGPTFFDIRKVDAGIGTDEAMFGFADDEFATSSKYPN
jgi:hypothetical protein